MVDIQIIAGSQSDEKIIKKVTDVLDQQTMVSYRVDISSAHRQPDKTRILVQESPAEVFICIAGLSAALPGYVASLTMKPVIGVPTSAALGGLDSLLSIAQMPKGVPVATVGIDNGANGAHLALRILNLKLTSQDTPQTYAEAGVDLNQEKPFLDILGQWTRKTFDFGKVTGNFGHYCNVIDFGDHVLALTTDGVGTKLLVAEEVGDYSTVGIDCLAMNVNDLLAMNITPLAFVDYLATDSLKSNYAEEIGKGLYEGCRQARIPLLGGETATIPEIVKGLDLAGTALGFARKDRVIDGNKIQPDDTILGLASSGLHSNGYTLARKVIRSKYSLMDKFGDHRTVAEELLTPTLIYRDQIEKIQHLDIHGLAHITGGGYTKLHRLTDYNLIFNKFPLKFKLIFEEIQNIGKVKPEEMFQTFNMGFGFIIILPQSQISEALSLLEEANGACHSIGKVQGEKEGKIIFPDHGVEFNGI